MLDMAMESVAGMIAPNTALDDVVKDIRNGVLTDVDELNVRFAGIHANYYDYEWNWAYKAIEDYYEVDLKNISADKLRELIGRWKDSVVRLDRLVYEDARKDFALSSMNDASLESNPFVVSIHDHIISKTDLYAEVIARLQC